MSVLRLLLPHRSEFIEAEKANLSVVCLCRALKVARASSYRWRKPAGATPGAVRYSELVTAVTSLHTKESGHGGRDQLTVLLNAAGVRVSAPTVGAGHHACATAFRVPWQVPVSHDVSKRSKVEYTILMTPIVTGCDSWHP